MKTIRSGDGSIAYQVIGNGAPVVLLHPFPVQHEFWLPVAEILREHFTLILPDLRGHGDSDAGDGPITMAKHARDLAKILDEEKVRRAPMAGVSIGGYVLFEFWRQHHERISALGLFNTKARADESDERAARLQAAANVLEQGTESFFLGMARKVMGPSTQKLRPDLVEGALRMMQKASAEDIAAIQRGMAERPGSIETLKNINVATLIVTGDEDSVTGLPEAELMHRHVAGSQMKIIARAGHYSPWEQPNQVAEILRDFLKVQNNLY
ncbi:MAG: alpha/beta fold hydrolase [Terriglobales bacterium]